MSDRTIEQIQNETRKAVIDEIKTTITNASFDALRGQPNVDLLPDDLRHFYVTSYNTIARVLGNPEIPAPR